MTSWMGLDPGSSSGGIAVVGPIVEAHPLPDTERDIYEMLCGLRDRHEVVFACIENVHSMPKQGVSSSFKFGKSYGFLRGILIASQIPFEQISPQEWQKLMSCRTHGDKNVSKARAQQLYPNMKITHRTADALLIACSARILWLNLYPQQRINPAPMPAEPRQAPIQWEDQNELSNRSAARPEN